VDKEESEAVWLHFFKKWIKKRAKLFGSTFLKSGSIYETY